MHFFYKLKNKKYLFYFLIVCFIILSIDFCFFGSIFNFKRYMFEKYGLIHFFILPIIITWLLFLKTNNKMIYYFKSKANLILAQLLSIIIIIFLVFIFIYAMFMLYILFFFEIPE